MKRIYSFICILSLLVVLPVGAVELPDFKGLVKQASPAVVNISTIQKESEGQQNRIFRGPNGEELPDIFKHFFKFPEGGQPPQHKAPESLGSGFIISSDGYLLTNHHVVADAEKVIVRLSDRRELEAEVVGSDERSDIALLKIDAADLPVVKLGSSAELEVGEWVLAIGSPFGFDHSVTAGIVSAKQRALARETYVPFIQTDVAINPGNSGGPLFNLAGEVVGINSQIYTRSGGFMGLSFAIPIDVAVEVANQIKAKGFVTRGWLGVIIQEVNRDLAESFGLEKPSGALVAKVLPDSPAEKAGLQEGDIIQSFDGREVVHSADLPHFVGRIKPGMKARMGIVRAGKQQSLQVAIGTLPDQQQLAQATQQVPQTDQNRLNIDVAELDQERRAKWQVSEGVVVRQVMPGAAAQAGLMVGDVITMLNGQSVASVNEFNRVVADLPEDRAVPLRIVRRGSPMFIPLKLGD
ncbi:DegQ family serine endoprotease [Pontibacter sp. JAM-7]|uniref:DegQ family serine endoprotease n=1 Tax=Pontibacter sp. JAM-7 TaxID=3366581 RepID=UPI003AF5EDB8